MPNDDVLYTRGMSDERLKLRRFVRSGWFSSFIYAAILFNTVLIALDDYYVDRDNSSIINDVSAIADWVILGIFTLECILKMVALGIGVKPPRDPTIDPELAGYFAAMWNRFDSFIVLMSWIFIPIAEFSGADISRLVRILRLTRPLRALREVKNLRGIQELLEAFPVSFAAFMDVTNLLIFVLLVYSILFLSLFGLEGKLHGRCVVDSAMGAALDTNGLLQLPGPVLCGTTPGSYKCPEGFRCSCAPAVLGDGSIEQRPYAYTDPVEGDTGCLRQGTARPWATGLLTDDPVCPDFGFTCFNNFGVALFTSFKTITLEGWAATMFWAQDVLNPVAGWVLFVSMIALVSFNILNLYVASMMNAYREVRKRRRDLATANEIEKQRLLNEEEEARKRHKEALERGDLVAETDEEQEDIHHKLEELEKKEAQGFFDRLLDPDNWKVVHKDATEPLNPLALSIRQILVYPQVCDECGTIVPAHVMAAMQERNLRAEWGPEYGRWRLIATEGGAVQERRERRQMVRTDYQEGHQAGEGYSLSRERHELRDRVSMLKRQSKGQELQGQELTEPVPWADLFILACIFINAASSMVEHFDGKPAITGIPHDPARACCDAGCQTLDEEMCPRGLIKMDKEWITFTYYTELIFNVIFTLELILKMVSWWGVKRFLTDNYPSNVIDLVIVVLSDLFFVLDIFVEALFNVSVFRLIRLLRAFKVATRLRRLKLIVDKAVNALGTVTYVLLLLLLWHILAALVAMQLFRCSPRREELCEALDDGSCPAFCSALVGDPARCVFTDFEVFEHCPWDQYRNFNTFGNAIVQLFFVTTGDNSWVDVMHRGMRSGPSIWPGILFFIFFYCVSLYCICNLFICVILEEFELSDAQKQQLQVGQHRVMLIKKLLKRQKRNARKAKAKARNQNLLGAPDGDQENQMTNIADFDHVNEDQLKEMLDEEGIKVGGMQEELERQQQQELEEQLDEEADVFFCLPPPAPNARDPEAPANLRWYVRWLLDSTPWTIFILLTIFASAVFLALDSTIPSKAIVDADTAAVADIVFFSIFVLEFVVKLLDNGVFWEHKKAYFRQGWNLLDFVLLLFQVLDLLGVNGLRAVRVLRVLRPLRLLNKIESLQLMLSAIYQSSVDIFNVLLLWLFAYVAFAVVGMYLFGGKFYQCSDPTFVGPPLNPLEPPGSLVGWRENCVGNSFAYQGVNGDYLVSVSTPTGILKPRVWSNPANAPSGVGFSFDNFGLAMQTLFEASTMKSWSTYVYATTDATTIGQHPIPRNNFWNVIFFQVWVAISCFFLLQMVIGVLIDAINQQTGTALFTAMQRNWLRTYKKFKTLKPLVPLQMPANKVRKGFWLIVNHPNFQNFITGVILFNIAIMTTEVYDQPAYWTNIMTVVNWLLLVIYIVEIAFKLIAYREFFFTDPWNLFDLAVVIASLFDELYDGGGGGGSGLQSLRVLRVLRVFKTFRLVRRSPRLLLIINTLGASIAPVLSAFLFMLLLVFLFSVLGNQFFSGLKHGIGITRHNNLDTTWDALLLLSIVVTGDNWQATMRDCATMAPACTTTSELNLLLAQGFVPNDPTMDKGDCGNMAGAFLFFDIFYVIGFNVLRSLFIAVLMENFFNFKTQGGFSISQGHIESYRRVWRDFDPFAKGALPVLRLREFLQKLAKDRNPLGSVIHSEWRFQTLRMELTYQKGEKYQIPFNDLAVKLGMYAVGPSALPYSEMLKRDEEVTWYGQLAAGAKMVALFRGMKQRRKKREEAMGISTTGALAEMAGTAEHRDKDNKTQSIASIIARAQSSNGKRNRRTSAVKQTFRPPPAQATVQEVAIAALATADLDLKLTRMEQLQQELDAEHHAHSNGNGNGNGYMNGNGNGAAYGNGNGNENGNGGADLVFRTRSGH